LLPFTLFGSAIQERLSKAAPGDYIVAESGPTITLFAIRSKAKNTVVIEEVSIPSKLLKEHPSSWAEWIRNRAPGHTSWSIVEIDLANAELLECYSFSKSAWLHLAPHESLLTTLLTLPLSPVPEVDRRKIGPPPADGEMDRRKIWHPPLHLNGRLQEGAAADAYQATWPQDGSELAGHTVLLYFDGAGRLPLPTWIQVDTPHASFSLRTLDAGSHLPSPHKSLPRRVPRLIGSPLKTEETLTLAIQSPKYYTAFDLFAIDVTTKEKQVFPISHSLTRKEGELLQLEISLDELSKTLEPDHRYTWLIVPVGYSECYVETPHPFVWQP
jgi:hypothetical protein